MWRKSWMGHCVLFMNQAIEVQLGQGRIQKILLILKKFKKIINSKRHQG
jgi:hypothetical protein